MKAKFYSSLAMSFVFASAASAADGVKMETLPAMIQKAIQLQVGDGKLDSIDKVSEDGEVIYDVEMTKDGKDRDFSVGESGELLAAEVFLPELPAAVQKTIQSQLGKGKLGDIYKARDEGEVSYDVEMTREGKARSFTVSDKGAILEEQVFLNELPAPIRKAIQKNSGGATLGEITKSTDEGEAIYYAEVNKGATTRTLTFNMDGVLLAEEEPATLSDAPEAAQKKIKSLAGDGKIAGLTKVTEDGDISYDVDILQGGGRKTLSVSAAGDLLDDEK